MFLGEISSGRCYNKMVYKEKKKEQYNYKTGMWNIRTFKRGGKLENLKKEMQKNEISLLGVSTMVPNKMKKEMVIIQCIIPEVNRLKNVWQ